MVLNGVSDLMDGVRMSHYVPYVQSGGICFEDVVQWSFKLPVVLIKETLKPFAYRVERFGRWKGAKMSRTTICRLPVWQFVGTNRLVVGHIGSWKLAALSCGNLVPCLTEPKDESFLLGVANCHPKNSSV